MPKVPSPNLAPRDNINDPVGLVHNINELVARIAHIGDSIAALVALPSSSRRSALN
jgi:hypothetical protein